MDIMATKSRLCKHCRSLNFNRLLVTPCTPEELHAQLEKERSGHDFDYSWHFLKRLISSKLSRTPCGLCRLILQTIRSKARWTPSKLLRSRYRISMSLWAPYNYCSMANEEDETYLWPLCLEVRMNRQLQAALSYDSNELMCLQASTLPKSPDLGMKACISTGDVADQFALGRLRSPLCDPSLLRMWLSKCEAEHDLCRRDRPPLTRNLRLIDVNTERVVEMGAMSECPRYVALSYEWGGLQRVCLQTNNLFSLQRDGLSNVQALHPCIRDAMLTVRNVEEQYLWVDALCIIQDDPEDVAEQISQMGQIYQLALLTIIAAPNINRPICLPGMTTARDPQDVVRLDDIALITSTTPELGSTLGPVTRDSSWYTRAWTMQESILSHRRLIFTSYQVYFICQTCDWCEDRHLESSKFKLQRDHVLKHQNELALTDLSLFSPSDFVFQVVFQEFVMMYSARRLGDERDRLKAMDGVLSVITRDSPAKRAFFWGIPMHAFEAYLCWSGDLEMSEGDRGVMRCLTGDDGAYFPSWSWLPWCEGVGIHGVTRLKLPYVSNIQPTIECYRLEVGTIGISPARLSPCERADAPWSTRTPEITADDILRLPKGVEAHSGNVCVFWTSVLQVEPFLDVATAARKLHLFATRDIEGVSAEISVHMYEWDMKLREMLDARYELVVLGWEMEGISYEDDSRLGIYVLLVRELPSTGICQRVGLGVIDKAEQWMEQQPVWKLVVLG